jgi:hypothetical protein
VVCGDHRTVSTEVKNHLHTAIASKGIFPLNFIRVITCSVIANGSEQRHFKRTHGTERFRWIVDFGIATNLMSGTYFIIVWVAKKSDYLLALRFGAKGLKCHGQARINSGKAVIGTVGSELVFMLGRNLKQFNAAIIAHFVAEVPVGDAACPAVQEMNDGMAGSIEFQSSIFGIQGQQSQKRLVAIGAHAARYLISSAEVMDRISRGGRKIESVSPFGAAFDWSLVPIFLLVNAFYNRGEFKVLISWLDKVVGSSRASRLGGDESTKARRKGAERWSL